MAVQHKVLSIYIDETDRWHNMSLAEAIVFALERNGIAGATVLEGKMGYGIHRRVHRKGLFGVADEKPVLILAVDEDQRLRSVLSQLVPMIKEGLITLHDVEIIPVTASRPGQGSSGL